MSMQHEENPEAFEDHFKDDKKYKKFKEGLPNFNSSYQTWYSEAKSLVKQLLPDRYADFVRHYERQANRRELDYANYTIEDYLQGLVRRNSVPKSAGIARMEQQLRIVESASQRFKSSLFDIRQLVVADLFDSEIETAKVLAKSKFYRAAGAICGVILEKHLAQVAINHSVKISKKNPTISDLNDALKQAGVIDTPQWRTNQLLGDIRNLCSHNKSEEPTASQVDDLLSGVDKVIKTIF